MSGAGEETSSTQCDHNTKNQIKHADTDHQTEHRCTWFHRFNRETRSNARPVGPRDQQCGNDELQALTSLARAA